jgi:hypothetical protein
MRKLAVLLTVLITLLQMQEAQTQCTITRPAIKLNSTSTNPLNGKCLSIYTITLPSIPNNVVHFTSHDIDQSYAVVVSKEGKDPGQLVGAFHLRTIPARGGDRNNYELWPNQFAAWLRITFNAPPALNHSICWAL